MRFSEPLPSNRKLPRNNTRTVDLERGEFQRLTRALADSLIGMCNFNPKQDNVEKLRETHEPMYRILKRYAEVAFEREFDTMLMFGMCVENLDLVNGTLIIKFAHTVAKKNAEYKLNFRNQLAPYSEEWLKLHRGQSTREVVYNPFELV